MVILALLLGSFGIYRDSVVGCRDGVAYEISLEDGTISRFSMAYQADVAIKQNDLIWISAWDKDRGTHRTVMYRDGEIIARKMGSRLILVSFSYVGERLFTDYKFWSEVALDSGPMIRETFLSEREPFIENRSSYLPLPPIFTTYDFNIKGCWAASTDNGIVFVNRLEAKAYPISGGLPRSLDLPGYVPPPDEMFTIDKMMPLKDANQAYKAWQNSFSHITGIWSHNGKLIVAYTLDSKYGRVSWDRGSLDYPVNIDVAGVYEDQIILVDDDLSLKRIDLINPSQK